MVEPERGMSTEGLVAVCDYRTDETEHQRWMLENRYAETDWQ